MVATVPEKEIHQKIYKLRGQQIMLDSELAFLYGVSTKRLNEQVRRNLRRFPPDFMFTLTQSEVEILRSQFATSRLGHGGRRYQPFAFTEMGVSMLSSILNSEQAIQVNIAIMRAFVRVRHALSSRRDIARKVEKLEGRVNLHDTDIRFLREELQKSLRAAAKTGPSVKGFIKSD